jgi:glutamate mutase epsilon subunit
MEVPKWNASSPVPFATIQGDYPYGGVAPDRNDSGRVRMLDLAVALAFVGMILLPAMVAMRGTSDDDDSQFDD